MINFELLLNL